MLNRAQGHTIDNAKGKIQHSWKPEQLYKSTSFYPHEQSAAAVSEDIQYRKWLGID